MAVNQPLDAMEETLLLTGRTQRHLARWCDEAGECLLHRAIIAPLSTLREGAAAAGIRLCVASGFRSFERQLGIWNAKARGERPVLDDCGRPCAWERLNERERVHAILRWSALPGASRHHWGTDFDVWDLAAVARDYPLRLEPEEYGPDGPFHRLAAWLDAELGAVSGFARPYDGTTGVAAEPWHLSYLPLAAGFERRLTPALLRATLTAADLELKEAVLAEIGEIHARFVVTSPVAPVAPVAPTALHRGE
jgi:LAS superfamily LD-carboxypeptidase LdcB